MEHDPEIFAALEQRLVDRSMTSVSAATRSHIIEAVKTEIAASKRRRTSITLPWVGIIIVLAAGMLQLAGSAANLENKDRPTGRSLAVAPDMLKRLSNDPAERRIMADSLAFRDPAPIRLLPSIDSRLANFRDSDADTLLQETP